MNPTLDLLQPYPFQKLRALFADLVPSPGHRPINLSIGEPQHPTPAFIREALAGSLAGLAQYPATAGPEILRETIADWLAHRYSIPRPDPASEILPVNGSREALFAFAQTILDAGRPATVIMPNPFYQIYEGAALLAGARPYYVNSTALNGFGMPLEEVPAAVLRQTQLVFVCSPGNPTGSVLGLSEWQRLFALSDQHGFVIASDECYSEIYTDESAAPLGALEAAARLGRHDYANLVVFSSLSKRSNVPGLRSGFVAGDRRLLAQFLLYRTYHGSAMSPVVAAASVAAWADEAHVVENRRLYREKFERLSPLLAAPLGVHTPPGGFYYWARTPVPGTEFATRLYRDYGVTVLPGAFLARTAHGENPGDAYVRIALVAPLTDCLDAGDRILACLADCRDAAR